MPRHRKLPPRLLPPAYRSHASHEADRQKQRRENVSYWSVVLGGLAALVVIATPLARLFVAGHARSHRSGRLTITEAYVQNGAEESYSNGHGFAVQSLASSPTIDLVLRNGTDRHVLVESAKVTIESYAYVYLCFSQGGGPLPEPPPHVARLPAFPLPSERTVEVHVHDEIDAEGGDSIPLRFYAPRPRFNGYGIYKLKVQVQVYGSKTLLSGGRFLLSTPAQIPSYDGYFPEDNSYFKQFISGDFKQYWPSVTWCLRRNLTALVGILSGRGTRSPELALLNHPALASQWSQMQDRTPPRRAALRLLHEKQAELAVFAASKSHDGAFERRICDLATTQLLNEAEALLTANPPSEAGEQDVRMALGIQSSPRGQEMLRQFERRLASLPAQT